MAERITELRAAGLRLLVVSAPVPRASALLTPAEREIARLVANGSTNLEIAAARGTGVRTVANQVRGLQRKLGVAERHAVAGALAEDFGAGRTLSLRGDG